MENEDKVIQENIPEENKQVSKKKRKKKNYIIEFIKRVVITGVIAYLLLTFVGFDTIIAYLIDDLFAIC